MRRRRRGSKMGCINSKQWQKEECSVVVENIMEEKTEEEGAKGGMY